MNEMAYHCTKNYNKECDGCGGCEPEIHYYCPICGAEVFETVYVNNECDVIGCENCAEIKEPHEVLENETN
jgi:hypothetical protein